MVLKVFVVLTSAAVFALTAGHWSSISVAQEKEPVKKGQVPDEAHYRLKVEPILEPLNDVAIYRAQVWTVEERRVSFLSALGNFAHDGFPRREKDGKYYRSDFVLLISIRGPRDVGQRDGKVYLEFRCMVDGALGRTLVANEIDAPIELAKTLEIRPADSIHRLADRAQIGKVGGKLLEVSVE